MATLFVRHTVADYKAWRKKFDEFQPIGAQHGVKSAAVYQAVDSPNDVTVTHDFDTAEAARTFVQAEGLKKAMQEAGVIGAPSIWITDKA
jgi:Antibiotic biosynthesis monooxygenase